MPEGVEVKLSAELIKPLIINKPILVAQATPNSRYGSSPPEGHSQFVKEIGQSPLPPQVDDIKTRGKFMYWSFNNKWYMFCSFGMSGQWSPKEGNHPCFHFFFNDNSEIYFNDPRHFGTIKFINNKQDLLDKLNELGWDPLKDGMDEKWLNHTFSKLSKSNKPIGQVMMDQGTFAGVGNYIRAEALYLAKISPWRPSNHLAKDEAKILFQSCVDVMETSYKYQGATIQTYKTAYGEEGRYSSCFKVYGKKTDFLGNKIIKEETPDKRTIHWCPTIQK